MLLEELKTFEETMQLLKISRSTLNRLVKNGKIQALKLTEGPRGAIRFRQSDIEKFITELTQNKK
jgi:excisionase family DNA binding protein